MADLINCSTCRYYLAEKYLASDLAAGKDKPKGWCRRYPPVPDKDYPMERTGGFPIVAGTSWCGEHWLVDEDMPLNNNDIWAKLDMLQDQQERLAENIINAIRNS